ncbi:hypothetical protein GPECTOR_7g1275 [Gonium pectorale]|uniref:Uncharacterized protein n=1 Tax=Gonium pectorale TaxID=33097 RepID=A0A150GU63_GONPE|nr:hypothetical protein GPECTOR_7g1275 [Gonium pectorale]|eukprot:KXZ53379.1 hypothetical protein GPECTOR_7g1275 [Gonium pectorale]
MRDYNRPSKRSSACTDFIGYNAIDNVVGSPGAQIANHGTDLDAAALACNADSACRGFGSDGFTYSSVSPVSRWTIVVGYCLYVKIGYGTVCDQQYEGYTAYQNLVTSAGLGSSYYYSNLATASAACSGNAACIGFGDDGATKAKVAWPYVGFQVGACLYIKIQSRGGCLEQPGFKAVMNVATWSGGFAVYGSNGTAEAHVIAAERCREDPACAAYNSYGSTFYKALPDTVQAPICFYIKTLTGELFNILTQSPGSCCLGIPSDYNLASGTGSVLLRQQSPCHGGWSQTFSLTRTGGDWLRITFGELCMTATGSEDGSTVGLGDCGGDADDSQHFRLSGTDLVNW